MKRIIVLASILSALIFSSPTEARLIDYYKSIGQNLPSVSERVKIANSCGIPSYFGSYAQNTELEQCLNSVGFLGTNALPSDNYDSFLTSPLSSSATTTFVNALPTGITSTVYTIFSNDGVTPREKIYCTGKSASPNKLTTCTRGVSFSPVSGVIDETAGTGLSHSKNARIAITDNINFSGKALAILNGTQPTGADSLYVGTATSTSVWLNEAGHKICLSSSNVCLRNNGGTLEWTIDGFSNSYSFTSSSVSQLSASSTLGIQVISSLIGINASSTTGMTFDSSGKLYQKIDTATGVQYSSGSVGIGINTTTLSALFTGFSNAASTTAVADKMPIASSTGKISDTWLNVTTTPATSSIVYSNSSGKISSDWLNIIATSSAVYSTTTIAGATEGAINYNWDNTFTCGFAPKLIKISYILLGNQSGVANDYSIGEVNYNGTAVLNNFYSAQALATTAITASTYGMNSSAPTVGNLTANDYLTVTLSVSSISTTGVTVRLNIVHGNNSPAKTQKFVITCYK